MKTTTKLIFALVFTILSTSYAEAATTTIQIYPQDDSFTLLYDDENQTDWSSARAYTGSLARPIASTTDQVVLRSDKQSGKFRIYRGSMLFDTSNIPNNATIQSASLKIFKGYSNNDGNTGLVFTQHTRTATTSIAKSDWQLSHYGSEIARGYLSSGAYSSFTLNSSSTEYIKKDDYTVIGIMTEFDYDNVAQDSSPKDSSFYSSEASGTSTDPYLEVTYEVDPVTVQFYPTNDGFTQLYDNDNKTTWSSARNYTGTVLTTPITIADQSVTRGDKQSGKYRIYRTSTVFDTETIPNDATITAVSFYGYEGYSNNHGQQLVITAHTRASSTVLAKEDWNLSNYGAEFARGNLQTGQYTEFPFNATGRNYINPMGYTVIGGMQDNDFDDIDIGSTPSGTAIYSSDATGTSTDPYLQVTYYDLFD